MAMVPDDQNRRRRREHGRRVRLFLAFGIVVIDRNTEPAASGPAVCIARRLGLCLVASEAKIDRGVWMRGNSWRQRGGAKS